LGVFFDATGTTSDLTNDFRDLYYEWNFGDSTADNWENGANTNLDKNGATGPLASHVYEVADTYTWRLRVFDGTTWAYSSGTVTASDWPNDDNTICVGNVLPVAGVNGVPSNATCVESADFDAVIATHIATNKRILFKRGDAFVASADGDITESGPILIGAYGSGVLPIVPAATDKVIVFSSTATDVRIMDLELRGIGITDTGTAIGIESNTVSKITLLRVKASEFGKGIVVTGGGENSLTDSVIQECDISGISGAVSGGVGFFGKAVTTAFLGNVVGPFETNAEHLIRVQPAQKVVVSNNTLTTPGDGGRLCLTIRAGEHSTAGDPDPVYDTQYVYVSDNKLIYPRGSATGAQTFQIAPASNSQNNWIADVIAERNWIQNRASLATSSNGIIVSATRVTLRNNLIDMGGSPAGMVGTFIFYTNTAGSPIPDDIRVYNNTIYGGDSDGAFTGIFIDTEPTATVVINNLGYSPESASQDMVSGTGTTPGTIDDNSSDAQVLSTDPFAAGSPLAAPKDLRIPTDSYAATDGTATFPASNSDFFNCDDVTANVHIGAFVPRARATCRGVK
jgi:hypothetical protein